MQFYTTNLSCYGVYIPQICVHWIYTDAATHLSDVLYVTTWSIPITPIPFVPWSLSLLQRRRITSITVGQILIWKCFSTILNIFFHRKKAQQFYNSTQKISIVLFLIPVFRVLRNMIILWLVFTTLCDFNIFIFL